MEKIDCPICQRETKTWIRTEAEDGMSPFIYRQCPLCRFTFLAPSPDENEMRRYYPPEYYGQEPRKFQGWVESFRVFFAWNRMNRARKFFPRPGRALDIGCGQGTFLKMLKAHGWECHGTELSAESADRASRSGIPVSVGEIQNEQFPPGFFDLISFWQVLEHLREPWKSLQDLLPLLKKGGVVAISTPNVESLQAKVSKCQWFHLDAPRHLCLFSPKTLGRMMAPLGFKPLEIHHFSLEQNPYGWLQSFLNLSGFPHDSLYTLLKNHSSSGKELLSGFQKSKMLLLAAGLSPLCLFLSMALALLKRGRHD